MLGVPSGCLAYFALSASIITSVGGKNPRLFLTHSFLCGIAFLSPASGALKILYSPLTCLISDSKFFAFAVIFRSNQKSSSSLIACSAGCTSSPCISRQCLPVISSQRLKKSARTPSMSTYISDFLSISPNASNIPKYTLSSAGLSTDSLTIPRLYRTFVLDPLTFLLSVGGRPSLSTVLPNFFACFGISSVSTSAVVLTSLTILPCSSIRLSICLKLPFFGTRFSMSLILLNFISFCVL